MKNPLTSLDAWMIVTLEKGTHWFQRNFHRTNFWLSKWCLTIATFFMFCGVLLLNNQGKLTLIDMIFMPIGMVAAFFFANYYWKVEEHKAFARRSRGEANPRKISLNAALIRWCFLSVSLTAIVKALPSWLYAFQLVAARGSMLKILLALLIFFIATLLIATLPLFFYLIACDPLPPSEEKARKEKADARLARATN